MLEPRTFSPLVLPVLFFYCFISLTGGVRCFCLRSHEQREEQGELCFLAHPDKRGHARSHLIKGCRHGLAGVAVAAEANWTVSSPAGRRCVGRMMGTGLNRRVYEWQGCIGLRANDTHQDCFFFFLLALSDSSRTAGVMEKNYVQSWSPCGDHYND